MGKSVNPAARSYFATLKGRMAEAGISQNALSRALGHSGAAQVSRWLSGKHGAHQATLEAVEAAFVALLAARGGPIVATPVPTEPPPEIGPEAGAWEATEAELEAAGIKIVEDEPPVVESAALEGGEIVPKRQYTSVWGRVYYEGEDGFVG